MAYTREQVATFRKYRDVTDNDVAFDWGLAGPGGAWFVLVREPHHTDEDMKKAENFIRRGRDVLSLRVQRMEEA